MKLTPPLQTVGRYTLALPWSTNPNVLYTCVALRSFSDIEKLGKDVYKTYYVPMNVTEGSVIGGGPFSFSAEKEKNPYIVTLLGNDNTVIYVPDTFITAYPQTGNVKYSHMVISVSLGSLPDYLDLSLLKNAVADTVAQTIGVVKPVIEHRVPSTENPTNPQHDLLETARLAAIANLETDRAKVIRLEAEKAELILKVNALTTALLAAQ